MSDVVLNANLNYTWNGEVPREVFLDPTVQTPDIQNLFTIQQRVKSKWQIHTAAALNKVTKADDGCGLSDTGTGIDITNTTLEVADLEIYLTQCADVFKDEVWETSLRTGTAINDLSGTDIQRNIIQPLISDVAARDMFRILSFGDTGSGDPDINQLDGLWTKMIAGVASYCVQQSSVSFGATLTDGEALSGLKASYEEAAIVLKQKSNTEKAFYVTGSVFENYQASLETKEGTEAGWKVIQDGVQRLYYRGIEVIPVYAWDETIAADGLSNPHRILYTTKANHIAGFDVSRDAMSIKTWYSDDDDIMKYLTRYKMGYQYIHCDLQIITI